MTHGAGILFITGDGRALLLRRAGEDHTGEWAFPGGGIEEGESPEQAARRELQEECGIENKDELTFWTRRIKDDVDFTTFVARVKEPFEVRLNDEHDAAEWVSIEKALAEFPLHPGAVIALKRVTMHELDVAKAIRDGELASPQPFGNILLIALRITGTGESYRPQLDEFVWRDPSLYLNDEFLQRCNGLPVVMEHPDTEGATEGMLDTKEFRDRVIGTIFVPYIQDDQVWGIAKIFDAGAAKLLCERQLSTSPTVTAPGTRYRMKGGDHLLVEGRPSYTESLAVVTQGVWDQGGPPSGVDSAGAVYADSAEPTAKVEDTQMPDPVVPTEPVKTDAAPDHLKAIMDGIQGIHAKCDALHTKCDSLAAAHADSMKRLDALEKPPETAGVANNAEPNPTMADGVKPDGESQPGDETEKQALEKERTENNLKLNDALRQVSELQTALAEVRSHMNGMPEDKRIEFVKAQMKAEGAFQAHGYQDGAPRWQIGETLEQYRRRLASGFQKYSDKWKNKDLAAIGPALEVAEEAIYADAIAASTVATEGDQMPLRVVLDKDQSGRNIRRYYGDPRAMYSNFRASAPRRRRADG